MTFTPYDRPVRAAFVGLGRIYDLNVRAYRDNPDVEVVALVDPSEERRAERARDWPDARTFASAADLAASGLEVDAVEALLPAPLHTAGVVELLGHGWHVNLQKPMCNTLPDAQRMLDAAIAELDAKGIEYKRAVQGESNVQIWINDPAGNTIELQQDPASLPRSPGGGR